MFGIGTNHYIGLKKFEESGFLVGLLMEYNKQTLLIGPFLVRREIMTEIASLTMSMRASIFMLKLEMTY